MSETPAVKQTTRTENQSISPASSSDPSSPKGASTKTDGGFKQTLTLFDLVSFGLVMLVPLSPFAIYGNVFQASSNQPALAYLIAFICVIPSALCFGAMIKTWQSSGSIFTFCYNCLSPGFGYIGGWMMILQYIVYPSLMYILAGTALHQFVPAIPALGWSFIVLAFVTVASLLNMQATVTLNRVALALELLIFAMFVFFSVRHLISGSALNMQAIAAMAETTRGFDIGNVMIAVALCMLSYIGFGTVATLTQEAKRPAIDPARSVIIIVIVVGIIFISTNLLAQLVDPSGSLFKDDSGNAFYLVAAAVGGEWFGNLCAISLALAMGIFSGLAGVISISRVIYIMANAGGLPRVFAQLDPKTNAPRHAMYLMAILSVILLLVLTGIGSDNATDINNFAAMSTYVLVDICVVWYCWVKRHDHSNIFTRLVLPAIGAIILVLVMASISIPAMITGVVWCVIGIAVYLILTRVKHRTIDLSG